MRELVSHFLSSDFCCSWSRIGRSNPNNRGAATYFFLPLLHLCGSYGADTTKGSERREEQKWCEILTVVRQASHPAFAE
jgi:hypothetical protein